MTDEAKINESDPEGHKPIPDSGGPAPNPPGNSGQPQPGVMQVPGLAAIALYMLFLAGTVILGVATRHFPPLYLIFPVFFFAAGLGLLMLFRWAWALALAAVVLLLAVFLYQFSRQHALALLTQGLLNFVFFLYLVRTEVRSRLR